MLQNQHALLMYQAGLELLSVSPDMCTGELTVVSSSSYFHCSFFFKSAGPFLAANELSFATSLQVLPSSHPVGVYNVTPTLLTVQVHQYPENRFRQVPILKI